ncbi:MAG: MbcA/ParS/Xre antitoxin family protein [Bryobacteraceae bacterium]
MSTAPQLALDRRSPTEILDARATELLQFIPAALRANAESVIELAVAVWEDEPAAIDWLTKPHPLLKNQVPIHTMTTAEGCDKVTELLRSLEYGLPM